MTDDELTDEILARTRKDALLKRVRQLRAVNPWHPMPFTTAVSVARYEMAADEAEPAFLRDLTNYPFDDVVSGEIDGFDVEVQIETDSDSTLGEDDVTGTFTDKDTDTSWPVSTGENWGTNGNGYKFYEPSNYDRNELPKDMQRWGVSRGNLPLAYAACIRRAEYEDRNREYYGMWVRVRVDGEQLGSASLWGIDTIPDYQIRPYLIEVAGDLIPEAITEAQKNLAAAAAKAEAHARRVRQLIAEATEVQ